MMENMHIRATQYCYTLRYIPIHIERYTYRCVFTYRYICFLRTVEDLVDALGEGDYIVNILPSTLLTRGLLDNDVLQACRKKVGMYSKCAARRLGCTPIM